MNFSERLWGKYYSIILMSVLIKIIIKSRTHCLSLSGCVIVTFLNFFLFCFFSPQNLNKQAYDLAKALLKRTAQAIEPYITNVSGGFYCHRVSVTSLSVVFGILNKLLRFDRNLKRHGNDLNRFRT